MGGVRLPMPSIGGWYRGAAWSCRLLLASLLASCTGDGDYPLALAAAVERDVRAGEVHSYRLDLQAEQFVRLEVQHPSIEVTLQVFAPDGRELSNNTSFPSPGAVQRLPWVAETAGRYRLDVHVIGEAGAAGTYAVEIDELRPATSLDGHRVAAERLHAAGYRQRLKGSPEALRAAIDLYEQALRAWQQNGDPNGQATTLNAIGFAHRLLAEYASASVRYLEALELWRRANDRGGEVDTLNNLGFAYSRLGEPDKALETYGAALALAAGDDQRQARVLNNLAIVYRQSSELDKALEHYQRAVDLWRAAGDDVGAARVLANMAVVFTELQEHRRALDVFHQAIPLLRQANQRRGLAGALNNLGRSYAVLGQYERAITYYAEALEISRSLVDERNESRTLSNLGLALHFSGQPRQALESFQAALKLPSLASDARFKAAALQNAARSYRAVGEMDRALDYSQRALAIRRAEGDVRGEGITLTDIAAIHLERGQDEDALALLDESLALSRSVNDPRNEAVTLLEWAGASRRRGDLPVALDKIEAAIQVVEARRSKVASADQRAVFLAAKRRFYDLRIEVLMELHEREPAAGYDHRALLASEQARARSLVDLLSDAQVAVNQRAGTELEGRELALQRRVDRLELDRSRLARQAPEGAEVAAIEEGLIRALAELEQVVDQIRGSSPAYAALTAPEPLTVRDLRRLLDQDTLLLELKLGAARSFLWVVSQSRIESYVLPDRATIDTAAREFYDLLTARELWPENEAPEQRQQRILAADESYPGAAAALSEMLHLSAAEAPRARRWLVVTEGSLSYVPFAALADLGVHSAAAGSEAEDVAWRPLLEQHEIVRLPSASALLALRHESPRRSVARKPLLVLADPIFSPQDRRIEDANGAPIPGRENRIGRSVRGYLQENPLRRLRFTRQEAEAAAAHVVDGGAELLLGADATRVAAKSKSLKDYRIVHFATHGVLNNRHPQLSALVLSLFDRSGRAVDGFLRLHDIYALELNAELVVLSACQTALGKEIKGEGVGRADPWLHVRRCATGSGNLVDRSRSGVERAHGPFLSAGAAGRRAARGSDPPSPTRLVAG